jgi:hypothetical protein
MFSFKDNSHSFFSQSKSFKLECSLTICCFDLICFKSRESRSWFRRLESNFRFNSCLFKNRVDLLSDLVNLSYPCISLCLFYWYLNLCRKAIIPKYTKVDRIAQPESTFEYRDPEIILVFSPLISNAYSIINSIHTSLNRSFKIEYGAYKLHLSIWDS